MFPYEFYKIDKITYTSIHTNNLNPSFIRKKYGINIIYVLCTVISMQIMQFIYRYVSRMYLIL